MRSASAAARFTLADEAQPSDARPDFASEDRLLLVTPWLLALDESGFAFLDHDGDVLVRLGALDVALAGKLGDKEIMVRIELAKALGQIAEPVALPRLISAFGKAAKEPDLFTALCRALGELGLIVPEDVSVVGYDYLDLIDWDDDGGPGLYSLLELSLDPETAPVSLMGSSRRKALTMRSKAGLSSS